MMLVAVIVQHAKLIRQSADIRFQAGMNLLPI